MKNTFLIAILFLIIGLVGGQFLDLNMTNQEGTAIQANFKLDKPENLEAIKDFKLIEIPDGHREYACWSENEGPIFVSGSGANSGTVTMWGTRWSCYAITFNAA
ncbi:MAG: hypothetical protein QG594_666 [Bacteroidota bacterium]|nr:hypothetical protein [Bacteroidota bacterium]